MKNRLQVPALLALAAVLLAGCGPDPNDRELQYMPDMYENPAVKPQEGYAFFADGSGMRQPPANTLPRNFTPYPFAVADREKAKVLENPLPRTEEVYMTGMKYFNIHCRPCHGVVGSGDGLVTLAHREQGFPVPPSLYSEKIRNEWADGEIFHVISKGQGQMPAYGPRIDEMDRWAIVHYVRALGVAANPTEEDLKAVEKLRWDAKEQDDPYRIMDQTDQLYLQTLEPKHVD
jgi:hypothetical protein